MVRGFIMGSLLAAGLAVIPTTARGAAPPAATSGGARSAPASRPPAPTGQVSGGGLPSTPTPAPDPERARLAAELERANAEIDALKRNPRGIRDDYRLRNRMADAQALARRLSELDARAARLHPATPSTERVGAWPAELPASAGDDRADLEAKADILTDQAGRLTAEANRIDLRIRELRARRELRRRAGQLERDPFSPLEQAKGHVVITTGRTLAQPSTETKGTGPQAPAGFSNPPDNGDSRGAASPSPNTLTPPTHGTTTNGTDGALDATASVAAQLRTVLDPAALAEIRRLETPGSAPSSLTALESALGTLRTRAAQLNQSAAALRARAATPP
jgi:hypothetical protein